MVDSTARRLQHGNSAKRIIADVEHDGVPVGGHNVIGVLLQTPTPKVGPSVRRRFGDRGDGVGVVNDGLQTGPSGQ